MGYLQTILVPSSKFSLKEAIEWIKKHNHKVTKVHITKNYYKFRQSLPKKNVNYYSYKLPNDVIIVMYE